MKAINDFLPTKHFEQRCVTTTLCEKCVFKRKRTGDTKREREKKNQTRIQLINDIRKFNNVTTITITMENRQYIKNGHAKIKYFCWIYVIKVDIMQFYINHSKNRMILSINKWNIPKKGDCNALFINTTIYTVCWIFWFELFQFVCYSLWHLLENSWTIECRPHYKSHSKTANWKPVDSSLNKK